MNELDVEALLKQAYKQAEEDRESITVVLGYIEQGIDSEPGSAAAYMKELPKMYAARAKTVDQLMAIARILEKMQPENDDDDLDGLAQDLDIYDEENPQDEAL